MTNKLRYLWISVTVAFFLSIQYFERYASEKNRMLFFWKWWDGPAIVFSACLIGLVFYFAYLLAKRIKNRYVLKIFETSFIAVFGIAIIKDIEWWLSKLEGSNPAAQNLFHLIVYFLYAALLIALAVHFFTKVKKIKNFSIALCLILSPLIPVFLVTSLGYKTWVAEKGEVRYSVQRKAANADMPDVFIFIFDEWSYFRSYKDKKLIPLFENLSRFKRESTSFHNAYVSSVSTLQNLPKIVFQNDYYYDIKDDKLFFEDKEAKKKMSVDSMESIFRKPSKEGYFTACVGFYHPYAALLRDDIDFAGSVSAHKMPGENFLEVTAYHILKSFLLYTFNFYPHGSKWLEEVYMNRYQHRRTEKIHKQTLSVIEEIDIPTFALFHYSIPHAGFVYDRAGLKDIFRVYEENVDNYMDNLSYLDAVIGEIISSLKRSGKYENSLIVMTSDHGWRFDPDFLEGKLRPDESKYIPLFIKFPNQKEGRETDFNMNLSGLLEFIERNSTKDYKLPI